MYTLRRPKERHLARKMTVLFIPRRPNRSTAVDNDEEDEDE